MSFINSILAGIEGKSLATLPTHVPPSTITPSKAPKPNAPTANNLAVKHGSTSTTAKLTANNTGTTAKSTANSTGTTAKPIVNTTNATAKPAVNLGNTNTAKVAAAGVKRKVEDGAHTSPAKTPKTGPKAAAPASTSTSAKAASQTTPETDAAKPPPKKGSFAEIMARGQALQAAGVHAGQYKYQVSPKLGGRERRAFKAMVKEEKRLWRRKAHRVKKNAERWAAIRAERGSPFSSGSGSDARAKRVVKVDLGYKGTARTPEPKKTSPVPAQAQAPAAARPVRKETEYKGTARVGTVGATKTGAARASPAPRPVSAGGRDGAKAGARLLSRRQIQSEEDEDDIVYDSDGSSDMEAAAFEVEEEEYTSLRQAQREDEEALREEMDLKSKKEMKKRALEALVAKRQRR